MFYGMSYGMFDILWHDDDVPIAVRAEEAFFTVAAVIAVIQAATVVISVKGASLLQQG